MKINLCSGYFQNDPLLMDLHSAVTVEEINAQIALEYGQAMTVNVKRGDGEVYRERFKRIFIGRLSSIAYRTSISSVIFECCGRTPQQSFWLYTCLFILINVYILANKISILKYDVNTLALTTTTTTFSKAAVGNSSFCDCILLNISAIVVMQNATVYDLKQAIKRHVDLRQVRENGIKYISWWVSK